MTLWSSTDRMRVAVAAKEPFVGLMPHSHWEQQWGGSTRCNASCTSTAERWRPTALQHIMRLDASLVVSTAPFSDDVWSAISLALNVIVIKFTFCWNRLFFARNVNSMRYSVPKVLGMRGSRRRRDQHSCFPVDDWYLRIHCRLHHELPSHHRPHSVSGYRSICAIPVIALLPQTSRTETPRKSTGRWRWESRCSTQNAVLCISAPHFSDFCFSPKTTSIPDTFPSFEAPKWTINRIRSTTAPQRQTNRIDRGIMTKVIITG